ncbi:MAG: hypothetical protein R3B70_41580 [Polyangiaceae bacterium]
MEGESGGLFVEGGCPGAVRGRGGAEIDGESASAEGVWEVARQVAARGGEVVAAIGYEICDVLSGEMTVDGVLFTGLDEREMAGDGWGGGLARGAPRLGRARGPMVLVGLSEDAASDLLAEVARPGTRVLRCGARGGDAPSRIAERVAAAVPRGASRR